MARALYIYYFIVYRREIPSPTFRLTLPADTGEIWLPAITGDINRMIDDTLSLRFTTCWDIGMMKPRIFIAAKGFHIARSSPHYYAMPLKMSFSIISARLMPLYYLRCVTAAASHCAPPKARYRHDMPPLMPWRAALQGVIYDTPPAAA